MICRYREVVLSVVLGLTMACWSYGQQEGKVYNGSFEKVAADGHTPDGWQTAGEKDILQQATAEQDPKRGHVGRLSCTKFVPGTSSSHAMIAQFGHVGVTTGKW
jgi:hypothetical protein